MITGDTTRYYLVCVIDDCTRLAWAEVITQLTSLEVMFASLKCINLLNAQYGIRFEAMLSDNGSEFASRNHVQTHPFERMLLELGIKHRYTRPYRPQTNGKVERFWRTLNDDLIEGTTFDTIQNFKDELQQYLLYYNTARPHQGLAGITPLKQHQNLSPNY
jgi:transposase InsO family protein